MTQNKNKKGIAKKALSISLVAAMLATSNVPVWASGFEAVDPTAEGFAVESAAPETEAVDSTEDVTTLGATINTKGYDDNNIEVTQNAEWGHKVSVTGNLYDENGNDVTGFEWVWLADGTQASNTGSGNTLVSGSSSSAPISGRQYVPGYNDYGKSLVLRIIVRDGNNIVYQNDFSAGTVAAKDISDDIPVPDFSYTDTTYTGEGTRVTPANYEDATFAGIKDANGNPFKASDFKINYSTDGDNFTDVTGKDIKATYSVEKYGYTGNGEAGSYQVSAKPVEADDFTLTIQGNTQFEYTGNPITFTKEDVSLVENAQQKDITASVEKIQSGSADVGDGKTVSVKTIGDVNRNEETSKNVWANYQTQAVTLTSSNTYSIVQRDLSKGSASLNQVFYSDASAADIVAFLNNNKDKITITGADGRTISYANLDSNGLTVSLSAEAQNAIEKGSTGTIKNGVILSATGSNDGYTGSVTMDLVRVSSVFGDVKVGTTVLDTTKPSSVDNAAYKVNYNGKAHDLKEIENFVVADYSLNNAIDSSNYDITYEPDNVNAGIVKATIVGKGSYAGNTKVVYFGILPAEIDADDVSKEDALTIDYNNDLDASLYADAFGLKIETTLDGQKVTLTEGTDYTVEYFYTAGEVKNTPVTTSQKADGQNAVNNWVTAKIKLTKDGNYKDVGIKYVSLELIEKSIENVTIVINPDSYTYTGEEIVPTVIVKDGSRYLYADEDYTLKLTNNVNAGTATATIVAKEGSGYKTGSTASKDFTITPANAEDVKVIWKDTVKFDYTGRQIRPTENDIKDIQLNGVSVMDEFNLAKDRLVYGENVNAGEDAGSVTIYPKTGNTNFTGTKTATFDIEGIDLTGAIRVFDENGKDITSNIPEYRYTGSNIEFADVEFVPTDKTLKLTEGTDYEFVYIDNLYPAGTNKSYLAVVAKGNYVGDEKITAADGTVYKNIVATVKFTITGATFEKEDITVSNGIYAGGLAVKPEVTVKVNDYILTEGVDYELEYDLATNATTGTPYDVTVKGIGAWSDSKDAKFTDSWGIDKRDLSECDVTVVKGVTTVKIGDVTVDPSNYTVKDNGDGSYTVTAVANHKNLKGEVTVYESVPTTPDATTLTVTDRTTSTVSLSWDKVDGAEGYTIWFRSEYDTEMSRKIIFDGDQTTWTQTGLQPGTKYFYAMRSWVKDDEGNYIFSDVSPTQRGTTKPIAARIASVSVSNGKIKVNLAGEAAGAEMYSMCYGDSRTCFAANDFKVGIRTQYTTRTLTPTFEPGTYYVCVKSYRDLGNGKRVYGAWSNTFRAVVK